MKRRALLITLLALATASGGCMSTGTFSNEVVCAESGQMRFISLYGPIGIASKVDSSPVKCPGAAALNSEGAKK